MPTNLTPAVDGHLEILRRDLAALSELESRMYDTGYAVPVVVREASAAGAETAWARQVAQAAAGARFAAVRHLRDAIADVEEAIAETTRVRDAAHDAARGGARA